MARKVFVALALLIIVLTGGLLPTYARPDTLDVYLEAQIATQRIPGLAVAYTDGRTEVRTYGDDITPVTRFRIGSLTKAMTAVAVLQLVESGLVDLDAPIQAYLPGFTTQHADWASRITVRHLLNQTSGLSDQGYPGAVDARAPDVLIGSFASTRRDAEPGTRYAYFNGNYDLLGRIVEVVGGQRYSTYMRENVFAPAGMADALVHDHPAPTVVDGLAQEHLLLYGFPIAYDEPLSIPSGSGGVIASGADMAAFLQWAIRMHGQSVAQRGLSLALLPIPLYIILLLPALSLALTGQAVTYPVLIAYLPDIMLLLGIMAALSVVTLVTRLFFWQRTAPAHAQNRSSGER